jgi:uncharacterized protein YegJ (DUF2314 family)
MHRGWPTLVCLSIIACSRHSEKTPPSQQSPLKLTGQDRVVSFRGGDPQMLAAQEHARQTLGEFEAALRTPPPRSDGFQIKVGFAIEAGPGREYLWLSDVVLSGDEVSGKVIGTPQAVALSSGQIAHASRADVADWMYREDGVLRGAFMLRVLLERASPEERRKKLDELDVRLE